AMAFARYPAESLDIASSAAESVVPISSYMPRRWRRISGISVGWASRMVRSSVRLAGVPLMRWSVTKPVNKVGEVDGRGRPSPQEAIGPYTSYLGVALTVAGWFRLWLA